MSPDEARDRMRRLRIAVKANDVHSWATSFLDRLAAHYDDTDPTAIRPTDATVL